MIVYGNFFLTLWEFIGPLWELCWCWTASSPSDRGEPELPNRCWATGHPGCRATMTMRRKADTRSTSALRL